MLPAKLDRDENGGHYKIAMNPRYTIKIGTHLAINLVELVTILDESAYCSCYEIDKNNIDRNNDASRTGILRTTIGRNVKSAWQNQMHCC